MGLRADEDPEPRPTSRSKHGLVMAIGAVLVLIGSAIISTLVSTSWNWPIGVFAILLIIEGLDCLFFALTEHDRTAPILLLWWPW
jgi:hypothetical protein